MPISVYAHVPKIIERPILSKYITISLWILWPVILPTCRLAATNYLRDEIGLGLVPTPHDMGFA